MYFDLIEHIEGKNSDYTAIWIFNIGIEKYWNNDTGYIKDVRGDTVVNHAEEMMLLLANEGDYVVLRKKPSVIFLQEIKKLKHGIANIICPSIVDEDKSITEIILEDELLLSKIKNIKKENKDTVIVPYGISHNEERLAQLCDIRLIGSDNNLSKEINNKIMARTISEKLGFETTFGEICSSFEEIKNVGDRFLENNKQFIIKSPTNASGKGMWVVDNTEQFEKVLKIVKRFIKKNPQIQWLVEEWIEDKIDINYQINIAENGNVKVFSIKEQVLDDVVYVGSYIPARIDKKMIESFKSYGETLGFYLFNLGYRGVFGVDALISGKGITIPILEINGRFTLSTYISFLENVFKDRSLFSYYINLNADKKNDYESLLHALNENNILFDGEKGTICYVEATADSELADGYCRLFLLSIGGNDKELKYYRQKTESIVKKLYIEER